MALTGDWHSTFVNDIHSDFDDPSSPVVGSELVGTSISSNGDDEVYGPCCGPMIKFNPHIKFFDGDRPGLSWGDSWLCEPDAAWYDSPPGGRSGSRGESR